MADTKFNSDIAIEAPTAALKHIDSKGLSTSIRVPLGKLAPLPGFNVRVKNDDYRESVRAFADSIRENGYYDHKPLAAIVLPGDDTIYVYDGETRYDALKLLETEGTVVAEVPVSLAPAGTTVEDLTVSMAQSNEGRALSPIALAELVKRLLGYGWDKDKVATKIGKTVRYLDNLLVLAGAPKAVREAVANNKIAAAEAVKIVRKDPKTAAATVTQKVKDAEAKGKSKATPKAGERKPTGPKMKRIPMEFSVPEGSKMGDVLKGIAKRLREEFGIDGNDVLEETGSVSLVVHVIDHEAEAAAAEKAKVAAAAAEAKATAAKAAAKPKAEAKPKAAAAAPKADAPAEKPKRTRKPAAAAVTAPEAGKTPEVAGEAAAGAETGGEVQEIIQQPEGGEEALGEDGMGGL